MGHLLGPDISKGKALATLKRHLGAQQVKVLALGDSPNDLPLLEVADVAVVVPGPDGPHQELCAGIAAGRFQLAGAPHATGWDEAVRRILRI
jgi:mannosyl-3-phosphoglycerate phosphatase